MARDALEQSLRTAWSFDELDVYGDHLQSEGDPRGELIALDRKPVPQDPSWVARRRAALVRWLGDDVTVRAGHLTQHGFVHDLRCGSHAPEVLDSPLGSVVRGYTIWGEHPRVGAAIARLASRPRLWLKRLVIAYWSARPYGPELFAELAAATPHLEELHLIGRPAFTDVPHKAVRKVVIDHAMTVTTPDDAERERRESTEYSTGWPLERAEHELFTQTIADVTDCNLLYAWYEDAFSEPMPALVARFASAGLVALDGPVARPPTRGRDERDGYADVHYVGNLHVDVHVAPPANLGLVAHHANHLSRVASEAAMPKAQRAAIFDYLTILMHLTGYTYPPPAERVRTLRSLVPALALALDSLLERRALLEETRTPPWAQLERFAGLLAMPGAQRRLDLRVA